jgi:general secretion pathway protein F
MPAFEYSALDAGGRRSRGVVQADTARAARAQLRERGLNPLSVEETRAAAQGAGGRSLGSGQRALLMRQLATLVASGLPIDESLAALAEGSEGRLRSQVMALRARVLEGSTLAAAMAEYPGSFPALYRASVAAGEAAGKLDGILLRLADYAESRDALARRVLLALTYPLLLSTVAIAVVAGLMVWVVPQVIGVFSQFGQALPLPTRILVALSDFVQGYGFWLLLGLFVLAVGAVLALRLPAARAALDAFSLRVPVWGPLVRALDTARFARTLALLTGAAVPLLEALSIASQVVQNQHLREALARAALRVREGQTLSRALADSGQFPPVAVRLIASGERSGRLDAMLGEAALQQERALDTALGVAMAALGPGVILLVGGLVLFVVLAILLPIFQINTLVR